MSILEELRGLLPGNEGDTSYEDTWDALKKRIMILSERAWEGRVTWDLVERWLANFDGRSGESTETEQLHALYILSQFLYFGTREIRVLLKAMYRDLFLLPLTQEMRRKLNGCRDAVRLRFEAESALERTRFLGIGNPAESGVHLLYYFRQENGLRKSHFLDTAQILKRLGAGSGSMRGLRYPEVDRYVFIDDICGSGETAVEYSEDFLEDVQALQPRAIFYYFAIFGTQSGMQRVRSNSVFRDNAEAVYELDPTYQCLSDESRYLRVIPAGISADVVRSLACHYGQLLSPDNPRGYMDSELLLGFHHNTPDNTIPLMWMDESHGCSVPWTPVFRRYPKI